MELGQQCSDVCFDRMDGDDQPHRDLVVREAVGDEAEHLAVSIGQHVDAVPSAPAPPSRDVVPHQRAVVVTCTLAALSASLVVYPRRDV